jgi:hypothetical protein
LRKLENYLDHDAIGMTKDQYLMMCEQTGEEIDWERCPPDTEDFPDNVLTSINIFNMLGDRLYGDVGYIGKDFTNLPFIFTHFHITETVSEVNYYDYLVSLLSDFSIK